MTSQGDLYLSDDSSLMTVLLHYDHFLVHYDKGLLVKSEFCPLGL